MEERMEKVVVAVQADMEGFDMLRGRVTHDEEGHVSAVFVFATTEVAQEFIEDTDEVDEAAGWKPIEIDLGTLVVWSAWFGVGHVAIPIEAGVGRGAYVGPVLEIAERLEAYQLA
jgi:hypothetical protein